MIWFCSWFSDVEVDGMLGRYWVGLGWRNKVKRGKERSLRLDVSCV